MLYEPFIDGDGSHVNTVQLGILDLSTLLAPITKHMSTVQLTAVPLAKRTIIGRIQSRICTNSICEGAHV